MEAKSLGDLLRKSVARHAERTAILTPGKEGFTPVTYAELGERIRDYAGALRALGLAKGDRVAILGENGIEWALADFACQTLGVVVVPIYPTLPADQVEYIVRDSGAKLALTGSAELAKKVECLDDVLRMALKGDETSLDAKARAREHALSFEAWSRGIDETSLDDLATIIYTSGTTGRPKGAMLPHRAVAHVCEAAPKHLPLNENDVFLSFLPVSHVYERIAGQYLPISLGATLAYAKSLASLASDMQKVRPTLMLCVPRFLESMRERILDGVSKQPPLRQKLFALALDQGVKKAQGKFAPLAGLTDKLVMAKARERTGGRLRYFVSGGAALPRQVAEFYMALGLTVLQGYGLTETSGGSFVNKPENNRYWTVGEPLGMEAKIADDGEILMRGPGLMTGYWNLPEETAQAIDAEGWFHTGDIGEFEGKNLKITDRKKDLIVLGNGKNVAPQPIESKLTASPFIQEAVVLGDGMDHCVALIVPAFEAVRKTLGLPEEAALADNGGVRELLKREIDKVNKTVAPFEMVKRFAVLEHPFSIETGELTPTLKVKRRVVREKFAREIAGLR